MGSATNHCNMYSELKGIHVIHNILWCTLVLLPSNLCMPVLTGWETANKYRIRNTLGQQVYFAAERECTENV